MRDVRIVRMVFGRFIRRLDLVSDAAIRLINIFTVVETVTLTVWLLILFPSLQGLPTGLQVLAGAVLLIGLEVEHLIAGVSAKV